jgi:hypothetical protein
MRHLWSLIAGVVLAPIVWSVAAFGQAVTAKVLAGGVPSSFESKLLIAAAALVGAGLLFGILATLRISPLGPLVAGLAYIGVYAWWIFAPGNAANNLDRFSTVAGYEVHIATPVTSGLAPVLGGALLISLFSVGRWRDWPRPEDAAVATAPIGTQPAPETMPADESSTTPTATYGSASATSSWTSPYTSSGSSSEPERRDEDASPWGPPPGTR